MDQLDHSSCAINDTAIEVYYKDTNPGFADIATHTSTHIVMPVSRLMMFCNGKLLMRLDNKMQDIKGQTKIFIRKKQAV